MANDPLNKAAVQDQGDVFSHIFTTESTPEILKVRGMDNLGKMSFITRGTTKFLSMLHTQAKGKTKTVTTREPRVYEIEELARVITILQVDPNNPNVFSVSNKEAAQFQPNDIFYVRDLYFNVDGTGNVGYSRVWTPEFRSPEPLKVMDVGDPNSYAPGEARVIVKRAHVSKIDKRAMTAYYVETPANPEPLVAGEALLRGLPAFPEGGDAPKGFHAMPTLDFSYTQEFKYAVEITKESKIEKTYVGKDPLAIYRMLKMRQANLDIERQFLFGITGKSVASEGQAEYTSGGVVEFIPKDNVHVYDKANLTYPNTLSFFKVIPEDGGSQTRKMFCGLDLYIEFKKAFYETGYMRYDPEASKKFDIPIESIIGAGITLNIIPLWNLQEAGWGKRALILDMDVPAFTPVTHKGWDMKVETNIQEKGKQIYKEQWVGIKGLERRYGAYQHIVDFPNI